jgi:hypothetical protein
VKGYQKRVIYLKNTGSEIFDEALFFVRAENNNTRQVEYNDMVNEANRIIDESLGNYGKKGRGRSRLLGFVVPFLLGVLLCSLAALLFLLI